MAIANKNNPKHKNININQYFKKKLRKYFTNFFLKISKFKKIKYPETLNFNKVSIDTSNYYSEMCALSTKYNTDKSPYNQNSFRHAYTGVYHFLFKKISYNKLKICEIGVLKNESIKLLRDYFKNSELFAFDNELELLKKAKEDNLKNVHYNLINVKDKVNIINTFSDLGVYFDIIIDDSTHEFNDQIRLIKCLVNFLKPGGTLIIEDIYEDNDEKNYYHSLSEYRNLFQEIYFIETKHRNIFTPLWNNNKILILEKKN